MATTALQIIERVQVYGYGTDTKAAQLSILNDVYKRVMNYRRWRFNSESKELFATVAADPSYSVSEDVRIDALRLEDGLLAHMDVQELKDRLVLETGTGKPQYWTQTGGEVFLWPIPDGAYKVTGEVTKTIPTLAEATNVAIPDPYTEILVWGTIIGICFRERDWDGHNFARQMYQEHLAELAAEWGMTDRQTSSQVVESGWYDNYDPDSEWPI